MIHIISPQIERLFRLFLACALLLSLVNQRYYQALGQVGVTICACQPSVYTFQINYTSICTETNVLLNPGIKGVDCFQRGVGTDADLINDTVPVQINNINVIELGQQFEALSTTPFAGSFADGSTFVYTSPNLATPEEVNNLTTSTVPGGVQIVLDGINKEEQPITNTWIILFTNDCGWYPVLDVGDNIGWTTLIDIQAPLNTVCPISGTFAPTPLRLTPSVSPSISPVLLSSAPLSLSAGPSLAPTVLSAAPSNEPSFVEPMEPTTSAPSLSPSITGLSDVPSDYGTLQPTICIPLPTAVPPVKGKGKMKGKGNGMRSKGVRKMGGKGSGGNNKGKGSNNDDSIEGNGKGGVVEGGKGIERRDNLVGGEETDSTTPSDARYLSYNALDATTRKVGPRPRPNPIPFCPEPSAAPSLASKEDSKKDDKKKDDKKLDDKMKKSDSEKGVKGKSIKDKSENKSGGKGESLGQDKSKGKCKNSGSSKGSASNAKKRKKDFENSRKKAKLHYPSKHDGSNKQQVDDPDAKDPSKSKDSKFHYKKKNEPKGSYKDDGHNKLQKNPTNRAKNPPTASPKRQTDEPTTVPTQKNGPKGSNKDDNNNKQKNNSNKGAKKTPAKPATKPPKRQSDEPTTLLTSSPINVGQLSSIPTGRPSGRPSGRPFSVPLVAGQSNSPAIQLQVITTNIKQDNVYHVEDIDIASIDSLFIEQKVGNPKVKDDSKSKDSKFHYKKKNEPEKGSHKDDNRHKLKKNPKKSTKNAPTVPPKRQSDEPTTFRQSDKPTTMLVQKNGPNGSYKDDNQDKQKKNPKNSDKNAPTKPPKRRSDEPTTLLTSSPSNIGQGSSIPTGRLFPTPLVTGPSNSPAIQLQVITTNIKQDNVYHVEDIDIATIDSLFIEQKVDNPKVKDDSKSKDSKFHNKKKNEPEKGSHKDDNRHKLKKNPKKSAKNAPTVPPKRQSDEPTTIPTQKNGPKGSYNDDNDKKQKKDPKNSDKNASIKPPKRRSDEPSTLLTSSPSTIGQGSSIPTGRLFPTPLVTGPSNSPALELQVITTNRKIDYVYRVEDIDIAAIDSLLIKPQKTHPNRKNHAQIWKHLLEGEKENRPSRLLRR